MPRTNSQRDFEDDSLWDALGRSRSPEPGPFFVQETMRRVRGSRPSWRPASLVSLANIFDLPAVRGAATAMLVVALAVAGWFFGIRPALDGPASNPVAIHEAQQRDPAATLPEDVEVIQELDVLLAAEETTLWTEEVF